ncbi:uncharacterized protein LOC144453640 [Glandiceps talaboti]
MSKHRKDYWELRSQQFQPSDVRSVLWSSTKTWSEELSRCEIEEFMSVLPAFEGKVVCDLAAGIGRYTSLLAKKAKHVIAVELVESYTQENKEQNGHLGNIDFITSDVVNVKLQPNSVDLIFCNYLLQYLDDDETKQFVARALTWLKEDGYLFTRDMTDGQTSSVNTLLLCIREDTTMTLKLEVSQPPCRPLSSYKDIFAEGRIPAENPDENFKLSLITMAQVQSVKMVRGKETDFYFLNQKTRFSKD